MKLFFLQMVLLLSILSGCSSPEVVTTWKEKGAQRAYNKIMVVGIVNDSSLALRKFIEDSFVKDLQTMGYKAVSALEEFGTKGLTDMEQEATYLKLCNNGIDAVITIALLNEEKERHFTPSRIKYYSALYYYNRIWNYQNMQAEPMPESHFTNLETKYLWESIFF